MKDLKALLALMFEPEDEISVSDCKGGYHSMPQATIFNDNVPLVSPKPDKPIRNVKTKDLNMLCINAVKGWRRDKFITSHRTFLWEIDMGSLASQFEYVKAIGLPYSSATYSGGKSIHFLTVLEETVEADIWKMLNIWGLQIGTLFDKYVENSTFDQNCKNPSRSVRIPGVIRPDTGKEQKLIELKSRIKLDEFMGWLYKYPHLRPKYKEERKVLTGEKDYSKLSRWLRKALKENDLDFSKGRNHRWYAVFYDFAIAGYSKEEAEDILQSYFSEEHDFNRREWEGCAKSAYDHAYEK
jgi:hypothetical protein